MEIWMVSPVNTTTLAQIPHGFKEGRHQSGYTCVHGFKQQMQEIVAEKEKEITCYQKFSYTNKVQGMDPKISSTG